MSGLAEKGSTKECKIGLVLLRFQIFELSIVWSPMMNLPKQFAKGHHSKAHGAKISNISAENLPT